MYSHIFPKILPFDTNEGHFDFSKPINISAENKYPKKEVVMIALGENGLDKITELFNCEKELLRLKQECEKLTDWEECNES